MADAGFVRLFRSLWDHPVFLDGTEAAAFAWMVSMASWKPTRVRYKGHLINLDRGQLSVSVRDLAQRFRWGKSTAKRFLDRLESEAMVSTDDGTGVSVITICNYDKFQSNEDASGTLDGTAAGQTRDSGGTQNKELKKRNIYPSSKRSDETFDAFWKAYPKRIGKGQAERAYAAALGKIDATRLLEATQRFAADCQGKDPKYIPHASTWLNGKRWEDEQPTSNAAVASVDDLLTPQDRRWMGRLEGWRKRGYWSQEWGDNPDQPGCQVPDWIRKQEKAA